MTLNADELARTRAEMLANIELTGLSASEVAADLRFSLDRLDAALHPDGAGEPVDVWLLRDYLERAVRDAGRSPIPFTVLTERSRRKARTWFRLQEPPRHDFTER